MKNEKAKSKKTDPKKDASKTKKPDSKKSVADSTSNDKKNQVAETENVSVKDEQIIYALTQETSDINDVLGEFTLTNLGAEYSETQLNQMLSGELVLPYMGLLFSSDKTKLEKIIDEKGWNVKAPATSAPLDPGEFGGEDFPSNEPAPENELTYDLEESYTDEETSAPFVDSDEENKKFGEFLGSVQDSVKQQTGETLDVTDPNQPIYDLANSNAEFAGSLNKKETELIARLSNGTAVVGSLSATSQKLLDSLIYKYESFDGGMPKDAGQLDADGQESLETFRTPQSMALEAAKKDDEVIQGEAELPLTPEEETRLDALKTEYIQTDNTEKAIPFVKAGILDTIRKERLWRKDYKSFGDFAFKEFQITREYAQQLAAIAGYPELIAETNDVSDRVNLSVNVAIQMDREFGKLAVDTGIGPEFRDMMRPLMRGAAQLLAEVSPTVNGQVTPSPRIVTNLIETVRNVVNSGTVEVAGEQYTVAEAHEKGLLNAAVQSEVLETAVEQIKTNKQYIIDETKQRNEVRTKAHEPAALPKVNEKKYFTGTLPTPSANCSNHPLTDKFKDNFVAKVFNAGFEYACGCKWQLLQGYDGFQCIECEGLPVKYD